MRSLWPYVGPMQSFVASIRPGRADNWSICRRESLWGIVGHGNNWRKNAEAVGGGDRIFVWRGGPPNNGFIAEARSLGAAEFVTPSTHVPWPDRSTFGAVVPIEIVAEAPSPLADTFPNRNGRVGLRYRFNNTVLQHVFEEIPDDVADRIARDFDPFRR